MVVIQLTFHEEEGIDPIDPTGEILITDGRAVISEKHAYLDSWLDALISGFSEVQAGRSASVDLVEEPAPLIFEPRDRGLRLSYKNTTLSVDSIDDFRHALGSAVDKFLGKLNNVSGISKNELIASIRNFR